MNGIDFGKLDCVVKLKILLDSMGATSYKRVNVSPVYSGMIYKEMIGTKNHTLISFEPIYETIQLNAYAYDESSGRIYLGVGHKSKKVLYAVFDGQRNEVICDR